MILTNSKPEKEGSGFLSLRFLSTCPDFYAVWKGAGGVVG
jgi:hypothetical protein